MFEREGKGGDRKESFILLAICENLITFFFFFLVGGREGANDIFPEKSVIID